MTWITFNIYSTDSYLIDKIMWMIYEIKEKMIVKINMLRYFFIEFIENKQYCL